MSLHSSATLVSDEIFGMNFQMFRTTDYLKIARRVVERVSIFVVDMLRWCQLTAKHFLHHNSMFWFVMSVVHINISVPILDVCKSKNFFTHRFAMPSSKSIVVSTQSFGSNRERASRHTAMRGIPIHTLNYKRVTMLVPPSVVGTTHLTGHNFSVAAASNNTFTHVLQYTPKVGNIVRGAV